MLDRLQRAKHPPRANGGTARLNGRRCRGTAGWPAASGAPKSMFFIVGWWALLLSPVVFVIMFSVVMETSYVGGFVLWVLALAFQVGIVKLAGKLFGA